jgi:hypothetical protein
MKSKSQKRMEAIQRQEKYNSLSTMDKLILIESRPGNSAKEIKRLLSKI